MELRNSGNWQTNIRTAVTSLSEVDDVFYEAMYIGGSALSLSTGGNGKHV